MSGFRHLTDTMLASPQVVPTDVAEARALGVTMIVNNRPEGESEDQTPGAEIEAAAREIDAMAEILAEADGTVLAYCRTGTRSTLLWSLAQAKAGHDPGEVAAAAAKAGYDVSPVRPLMDMLIARAKG
jgi:uncharacterized protein (TIGR01244 family)